jgi:WhiB family redox-sensing transcriptional regulator
MAEASEMLLTGRIRSILSSDRNNFVGRRTSPAVGGNRTDLPGVEPQRIEEGTRMDTAWMARGSCVEEHPSFFFPSDGVGVTRARKVCANCQVRIDCLEYALENRIEHGVWGGASERERRRILKRRRTEVEAEAASA